MKFQVSQKILAVGGDFSVRDEAGREAYYFDGKMFSLGGKKVIVLDTTRREVARIRKKLFCYSPTYAVTRNGVVAAVIRKKAFTFRDQFIIDVPGTNDYEVIGDYMGHEYTIRRGKAEVAWVSKRYFGATDSYGVEIKSGEPVVLLCAVVVIDMVLYKKRKS